jgi:hypothetical protein
MSGLPSTKFSSLIDFLRALDFDRICTFAHVLLAWHHTAAKYKLRPSVVFSWSFSDAGTVASYELSVGVIGALQRFP